MMESVAQQIGVGRVHCSRCNRAAKVFIWDRGYYRQLTWQPHRKYWWWRVLCGNTGQVLVPIKNVDLRRLIR